MKHYSSVGYLLQKKKVLPQHNETFSPWRLAERETTIVEPGRGQLHAEPHVRPITCHVASLSWQEPEEELNKLLLMKVSGRYRNVKVKMHGCFQVIFSVCNSKNSYAGILTKFFALVKQLALTLKCVNSCQFLINCCLSLPSLSIVPMRREISHIFRLTEWIELECGPMANVMAALPNIGGALCSTPQSLADAHYQSAVQ